MAVSLKHFAMSLNLLNCKIGYDELFKIENLVILRYNILNILTFRCTFIEQLDLSRELILIYFFQLILGRQFFIFYLILVARCHFIDQLDDRVIFFLRSVQLGTGFSDWGPEGLVSLQMLQMLFLKLFKAFLQSFDRLFIFFYFCGVFAFNFLNVNRIHYFNFISKNIHQNK